MYVTLKLKTFVIVLTCAALVLGAVFALPWALRPPRPVPLETPINLDDAVADGVIKWAEFNVTYPALKKAMEIDIKTYGTGERHVDWIELLSFLGAKYGGNFKKYRAGRSPNHRFGV